MLLAIKVLHKKGHTSYDFGLRLDRQSEGQVEFLLRHKRFYIEWDASHLIVARLHPTRPFALAIWSGLIPTVSSGWQKLPLQYEGGILSKCQINLVPVGERLPTIFPDPDWIHQMLSTLH